MVRKPTRNNYRQYYKEYYNIDFDKTFAIHHIDGNRDNNDISNLLLLPSDIHDRFHISINSLLPMNNILKFIDPSLKYLISTAGQGYCIDMTKIYIDSLYEISKWIGYKELSYKGIKI